MTMSAMVQPGRPAFDGGAAVVTTTSPFLMAPRVALQQLVSDVVMLLLTDVTAVWRTS